MMEGSKEAAESDASSPDFEGDDEQAVEPVGWQSLQTSKGRFEKRAMLTNKRCLTSRVEGGTQDQCQFWLKLVSEFYPPTSSL